MKMPKETYTDQEIEKVRLKLIGYLQKNYGKQYKKDAFIRLLAKENNVYHQTLNRFINNKELSSGVLYKLVKKLKENGA
jgi:hypothetical protein